MLALLFTAATLVSACGSETVAVIASEARGPVADSGFGVTGEADARTGVEIAGTTPQPPPAPIEPAEEKPVGDPRDQGTIVGHAITDVVVAHEQPSADSPPIQSFANPTDNGGPLVFQGLAKPVDGWLEVLLPIRPNGTTGWIPVDAVDLTINPYRIEVDASAYRLTIFRYGEERLQTTVAIGTGDTPTPIGDFFLIELMKPTNPDGVYGPYAYGLSGYSDTLEKFNGGEGVIGIHGTNQPDLLGQDVSHGCIRVANPTITEMTEFLPLGTPVSIFRSDAAADPVADPGDPVADSEDSL